MEWTEETIVNICGILFGLSFWIFFTWLAVITFDSPPKQKDNE